MCFALTFNESCLDKLDQLIFDNVPIKLYSGGCWLISQIVKAVTGATPQCVGIFNLNRLGMVPHWINKRRSGGVIDLKRRCFKDGRKPIRPTWQEDGLHYAPPKKHYFYLDKNGRFIDKNAFWAPYQHDKYIDFVENDTWAVFDRLWLPYFDRIVNKWFHNEPC